MKTDKKIYFKHSNRYTNKIIFAAMIILAFIGFFSVISAEMGESSSDTSFLLLEFVKLSGYIIIGLIFYFLLSRINIKSFSFGLINFGYFVILILLFACRIFKPVGGAYAWLRLGIISVQPSEFAKLMVIILGAKYFSRDAHEKNVIYFGRFIIYVLIYVAIVVLVQKDLGSGVIILIIGYCICLINPYEENKKAVRILYSFMLLGIVLIGIGLSPIGTRIFELLPGYQAGRFLASADPFKYVYDVGYHVVMSLVTFANGGIFGLGYGKSIHKYMNFPNPSTDFILPVIVEEVGIIAFFVIVALYLAILLPLTRKSRKTSDMFCKVVFTGCVVYMLSHFILNVGGVSGLIPLTGVPLLMISGGGSSMLACMMTIGCAQSCIIYLKTNKV